MAQVPVLEAHGRLVPSNDKNPGAASRGTQRNALGGASAETHRLGFSQEQQRQAFQHKYVLGAGRKIPVRDTGRETRKGRRLRTQVGHGLSLLGMR